MGEVLVTDKASRIAPAITGTGTDGFVITWIDSTGVNVKARILGFDGVLAGEEFQVNETRDAIHPVAALAADGFAIAWIAKGPPARVLMRRFSPDGATIGNEIQVSSAAVDAGQRPVIARLPDRTLIVAWVSSRLDEGVRAAFFSPGGALRGEVRVDGGHPVNKGPLAAAGLSNNSFAIAWRGGDNDASVRTRVQIFAPDTTKPVPEKKPNLTNSGQMSMTLVDGELGHFVLAYTSPLVSQTLVVATVFDANAELLHTFNVTHRDDNGIADQPAAAAAPGRRFHVAWSERSLPEIGDRTGTNVKVRFFSEDDGALQSAINIAVGAGDQRSPCIMTMVAPELGTRTAMAWIDDSVSGPNASVGLKASVLGGAGPII